MEREQFLKSAVQRIIIECLRHLHNGKCLEYVTYRVECCSNLCSQAMNSIYLFHAIKEVIEILRDVYLKRESVISDESIRITEITLLQNYVVFSGAPGRPKFAISEEILIHLKDHGFTHKNFHCQVIIMTEICLMTSWREKYELQLESFLSMVLGEGEVI